MTKNKNPIGRFWQEFKRRNVAKVIIIYASTSFILLQVADLLIKPLYLPMWVMTLLIIILAVGFPVVMVIFWIFEITPEGIEKTQPATGEETAPPARPSHKRDIIYNVVIGVLLVAVVILLFPTLFQRNDTETDPSATDKSLAVLPFKNESNDSTNRYFINGLMESILTNLQKIEDLRVVSRTSVEKYRNSPKSISEIQEELDVGYLIEGSGQKVGDRILLNIQLIDAGQDKHLWAKQYSREGKDIFQLQLEVAQKVADEIEVVITPEVEARISKAPTDDLVAYDYFLKGLDLLNQRKPESLKASISWFDRAIERDNSFARAYAAVAMAYYYLDEFQAEKQHLDQINYFADQAILLDPQLPQSQIAKALFYMGNKEYEQAVAFFEKALELNPNDDLVYAFLVDLYANYLPNTEKYLEYALRGLRIDPAAYDSVTMSFNYLHISNAFIRSGFVDEAEQYINRSLEYHPGNLYAAYLKAYILYARNRNLEQTKRLLLDALSKDTNRLDIIQEVGKVHYYLRDYTTADHYYSKYLTYKNAYGLDIYRNEDAKIGVVFAEVGKTELSEELFTAYKQYSEADQSPYRLLNLAVYYAWYGETWKALDFLQQYAQQDSHYYWTILFLRMDPLVDNLKGLPEFDATFQQMETRFWEWHNQIRDSLEEKGLI